MGKLKLKQIIERHLNDCDIEKAVDSIILYKDRYGYDDEIASMEAIAFVFCNNYEDALSSIREGLKYNLFNSDLYYTMGNIYEALENVNRAFLCYEQALNYVENLENKEVIIKSINKLKSENNIDVNNYSIILLTYNNLEYTKLCVESIRSHANNYEIIIVDNNSTDDTVKWIKEQNDIKYILNEENKGFPAGCNQGIEIAKKENDIFLLNNDTVIMPNSIFNLRMGLYSDKSIGATGSVSNKVSNYQQISEEYDNFDGYLKYSLINNITNDTSYEKRIKLVAFAMMIKRKAIDNVGGLDERFTPGNFEDDDISLRILLGGYSLLLCKDSYIHHFGSVSFKKDRKSYNDLLRVNSNKFKEKWGFSCEYSTRIRYDLISFINENREKKLNILEVGCACGSTLLEIKNRFPNSSLYGIEINESSARVASQIADIRAKNIEVETLAYDEDFFDYIIFGDVLEHLSNPEMVLNNIKKYLKDGGSILASIPNVMHYTVIRDLINGNWTYQDAGILDKTHIKFFTKNEMIKLFKNVGFEEIKMKPITIYQTDSDKEFIDKLKKISYVNIEEEFETYQYLIKARKNYGNSKEVRECIYLLRRIEFDIDIDETEIEILNGILDGKFTEEIISEAVEKSIVNKVYILNYLAIKCYENNVLDMIIPLLNNAYDLNPQDLNTNYNIAYILSQIGEEAKALDYLNNLNEKNEDIEELKVKIRRHMSE